ncbi:MAG: NRDE family protein [Rhodospirillaceae bacterium]|nr:NRDE family protein [Rhodospirillales bacterium]
MCTLVILRRSQSRWPVLVAANRDEMAGRPWKAPGRHWSDRPDVIAGMDELAGGSWLGINHMGVMAAILNRVGTLGPQAGKRSRGELVLEALDHNDALDAAEALAHLDGRAYRPFNMVLADNRDAYWVRADGSAKVQVHPIGEGLHIITALDLDDPASPRVAAYAPRFADAAVPDPDAGDWTEWAGLMAHGGTGPDGEEAAAMCFTRDNGFGTVSSSLIALPEMGAEQPPQWLFAPDRPDRTGYTPVILD